MIFGLQGSKLLVKVANTLFNPESQDGESGTFDKKKKILPDGKDVEDFFSSMADGLLKTFKNTYNKGGSDELWVPKIALFS